MTQRHVLGLFAKRPEPGKVKTRLAAETSPEWAAEVARACLLDMVERVAELAVRRVLAYAPVEANPFFETVAGGRFDLLPQIEGDLGQRMKAFFGEQVVSGAQRIVLLGTDSPTLPVPFIAEAFERLDDADLVLGPAMDGGYYLIGCGSELPPVFDDIAWSTPGVLAATVARLAGTRFRLALLPPWYDLDTQADWLMLCGHLAALRRAGFDPDVPHLEALATRGRQSMAFEK